MKKYYKIIIVLAVIFSCTPKYIIDHNRPVKPMELPKDEAAHYNAQMEWWYYTGHLQADDGSLYGFEVSFFKRLLNEDRSPGCLFFIPAYWFFDVGMLAHFAVSDLNNRKFASDEINSVFRCWEASPDKLSVGISGWTATSTNGAHIVKADMDDYSIDLILSPAKNPVFNGPGGIVAKSASYSNYYYSYTNLDVTGKLTSGGKLKNVTGKAWMDHEYGTMKLDNSEVGWDWFSIQLEDNTELMLYIILNDKNMATESGGTYVDARGNTRWLKLSDFKVKTLDTWFSKESGAHYPSHWEILVKPLGLVIEVKPVMENQELTHDPVTYWEGAVSVNGTSYGKPVKGKGYVELVGYAPGASFIDLKMTAK